MTVVLQIVPALVNGGVERGTVEVAAALVAKGHTALVASSGGPMAAEISERGGRHICLPLASKNPWIIYLNSRRLARLIRAMKVDIVHARSRAPAWSAWLASRATGAHFVTTFHNAYGAKSAPKRLYNSVMAKGERVIAISNFVGNHVAQTYRAARDRLCVIHRGVDITIFDPALVDAKRIDHLRTAWHLDPVKPVIMLPGRISGWKGHEILLAAVAQLNHAGLQIVLVGGGDKDDEIYIDRLIVHYGLGGSVKNTGTCRDMPAAYLLADIVVSPATRPEGFGRVIAEAQAMGRMVIATNHGGARETVIDGKTGWLVPPGDVRALAQAIASILKLDPAHRAEITAAAIAHIRARFTTTAMTDSTLAVYDEVMASKMPSV